MRYLRDLSGPYRGQLRRYLDHAAQNAIDSGFAETVTEPEVEAYLAGEDTAPSSPPEVAPAEVTRSEQGPVTGGGDPASAPAKPKAVKAKPAKSGAKKGNSARNNRKS